MPSRSKSPSAKRTPSKVSTSASKESAKKVSAVNVLLYYPNLIGYLRIACMILSFYYALDEKNKNPLYCLVFYLLAFGGDVVDGYVARLFNQSSRFGGVLDMVTDRVSTCGFLCVLMLTCLDENPHLNTYKAIMLIVLDISSHWFHVVSVSGHHKSADSLKHRNPFLQWYYGIYPLFGYCCVGTEFFYILLYVLSNKSVFTWVDQYHIAFICWYICMPACILKQVVNLVQLWSAAYAIAESDAAERK